MKKILITNIQNIQDLRDAARYLGCSKWNGGQPFEKNKLNFKTPFSVLKYKTGNLIYTHDTNEPGMKSINVREISLSSKIEEVLK